jgi:hypothetical protein
MEDPDMMQRLQQKQERLQATVMAGFMLKKGRKVCASTSIWVFIGAFYLGNILISIV